MSFMRGRAPAYPLYLILSALAALSGTTIFTINLVYQHERAGLGPLELILVGTTVEATVFLCEVPTGVVADVYSRRLSVIIGFFLMGAGFLIEGLLPYFGAILAAQLVWGVGATFISGALDAWIADEIGEERAGHSFLRGAQAGQAGALAGIGLSVALASVDLSLAIVTGATGYLLLSLGLALTMPEHGFTPVPREERGSFGAMARTFRAGLREVRGSRVLLTLLAISLVHGVFSEPFDRLWQVRLLDAFTFPALGELRPVVWFGVIGVAAMLLALGATELVTRRVRGAPAARAARVMMGANAVLALALVTFATAGRFDLAVLAYLLAGVMRRIHSPLYTTLINRNIDRRVRATVLSMSTQVNSFGQIAGGPALGLLASAVSIPVALVCAAVTLLPAVPLSARLARSGRSAPAPMPVDAGT